MPSADPRERSLIASIASHTSWANTTDRSGRTAAARRASEERFQRLVDPDGSMSPTARAAAAENARQAFFQQLSRKGAAARRTKAAERRRQARTDHAALAEQKRRELCGGDDG